MHLVCVGLNHKTAPVGLRERLSIPEDAVPDALFSLKSGVPVSECLVLSTCNRTEVYFCAENRDADAAVLGWMCGYFGILAEDFTSHLYSHAGHKAAEHLFRVASGVDSMVIGEAQVLGQVKTAYAIAGNGYTGPVLNGLFQQAISVGKRVRTETEIGKGAFSVGSVAVRLAGSIFDKLAGRTVLVVGAGEMSELAISHLVSAGASSILVANRTYDKAVRLADEFHGKAIEFEAIAGVLADADIVITSTGSTEPILSRAMVSAAHHARRGRPVFLIDMAVPRDIAPEVGDLDNVFLYNIDDLQAVVAADLAERHAEVERADAIIVEEVGEFLHWFRTLDAVPVIIALRDKFEDIRSTEFERLVAKCPDLTPKERDAISAAMRSVVNKICHQPMLRIKEYAADQESSPKLETICDVFGICPDDGRKPQKPGEV